MCIQRFRIWIHYSLLFSFEILHVCILLLLYHAFFSFYQAKLPSVLRIYRDTLIADMKTAIKTTVAELLPSLIMRPTDSDFTTGERPVDTDGLLFDNLLPVLSLTLQLH